MLYLEDFLELIDQLPLELRDRFTDMRTLDLEVQNGQDRMGRGVEAALKVAPSLSPQERSKRLASLKAEYNAILAHADEKITIANSMYDLVERYQRKLEEEAGKFRLELEADSPGITAILEQKVRDAEASNRHCRQERKKAAKSRRPQASELSSDHLPPSSMAQAQAGSPQRRPPPLLPHSNPLLSSPPAANLVPNAPPLPHPPHPPPLINTFAGSESRHGRQRKPTSRVQEMLKESMEKRAGGGVGPGGIGGGLAIDGGGGGGGGGELGEAGDGRKWCICNQTSFGEMVACDNPSCVFEWFHYECVGIAAPPKGKWFCPHCIDTAKRRREQQQQSSTSSSSASSTPLPHSRPP